MLDDVGRSRSDLTRPSSAAKLPRTRLVVSKENAAEEIFSGGVRQKWQLRCPGLLAIEFNAGFINEAADQPELHGC